jgi:hypothetical protein
MKLLRIYLLACILLKTSFIFSQTTEYSFFIAGHVYGSPGINNLGFHPPFKAKFNYIQGREEIKFGILLGDIVITGTEQNWNEVDAEVDTLGLPVYFAPGNHDMTNRELYENRYGDSYFSFTYNNDLFIILDPNIDNWNISGDQLSFVESTLEENANYVINIFVLSHQLIWWAPDNIYSNIVLNSNAGRDDVTNFWSEVEPLFNALDNNVFFCAGDVGAASYASSFMYDQNDNITYIATGMGSNVKDNFIVINVDLQKQVSYDLICLNSDELFCFGELEDYIISYAPSLDLDSNKCFPNPASNEIFITTKLTNNPSLLTIFDTSGMIAYCNTINTSDKTYLKLDNFKPGLYYAQIQNEKGSERLKFLVITP